MTAIRVRKLKKWEASKTKAPAEEKPALVAETEQKAPTPTKSELAETKQTLPREEATRMAPEPAEPEPVACHEAAPSVEPAKEAPSPGEPAETPQIDLSSPRAEFSLQIGSLGNARESMVESYFTMVLFPMIILLAVALRSAAENTLAARGLADSAEFMLAVTVVFGAPLMAVSWFHGLYPKGSYGRFAAGSARAFLLSLWLVLVLVASNLQSALADLGADLKLEWLFVLICVVPVFFFGAAMAELVDDRKAWRKKMGAQVRDFKPDLSSRFVDFDRHIGTYRRGSSTAWMAYIKFLAVPVIVVIAADFILGELDLEAKDMVVSTLSSMLWIVFLFGITMVILRFLRGFYPCGSVSRMIFGLAGVPVMIAFAWAILVGSGIEDELEQNHFFIDLTLVLLPVLMYVVFYTVFEVSEFADVRRAYRRRIGLPVKPYIPEELYNRYDDFKPFYASFVTGTRDGRLVLYKYAIQILIIVILVATGISVYESPDSGGLNETVRSYLNPPDLEHRMDNMIFVLLILAVANTACVFIAWSYREGSFARLLMAGIVALLASQWAYSFWSSLAKIIQSQLATEVINYIMFGAFGVIMLRAAREVYKGYLRSRNKYLDWRLTMVRDEIATTKPPAVPVQAPSAAGPPSGVNGRGA